ncbi:MAG: glycosyltransferase family 2 protein [Cyclobacteriaceae bacterium]|nr:glycosyltransferase family 2 protein [Cyclobacteriaceae bacterium]
MKETVSVVVLTYNGLDHVKKLLPTLAKQTIQADLIVIDSSSSDGTCEYLDSQNIPYTSIQKEQFDHGGTRNLGLSLAQNELVVFLTQDVILDNNDSVEFLIKPLQLADVAMSFGRQLPKQGASVLSEFARLNNYPEKSFIKSLSSVKELGIKTPWISNSFAAYKKSILNSIGGFPSNLIMCEDVFVGAKAILKGYKIAYVAEAKVFHSHNYSIVEEFTRYFDIGYFYNSEYWILENFSKAEAEGLKFIRNEIKYLNTKKKWLLLPEFLIRTTVKYVGYNLGKYSKFLPDRLKPIISMHSYYWKKKDS